MDAPGNDLVWQRGLDADACERFCVGDPRCAAYTYSFGNQVCIPKSAVGPVRPSSVPALTGIVRRPAPTGSRGGPPHPPGQTYAIRRLPNLDAPGNDLGWHRNVDTVEACESLCLADPQCTGYTFNSTRSVCFRKSQIAGTMPARDAVVSGIITRQAAQAVPPPPGTTPGPSSASVPAPADRPSFDCIRAATTAERTVCATASLSRLDVELDAAFKALRSSDGIDVQSERRKQDAWHRARDACQQNVDCLSRSYSARLSSLQSTLEAARMRARVARTVQDPPDRRLIQRANQPCATADLDLQRFRRGLTVTGTEDQVLRAGVEHAIAWTVPAQRPRGPTYLVIGTESSVRFRGGGFYALMPAAAAPFRLKQLATQTRAVIPLHVEGAMLKGSLQIRPLVSGRLQLTIAVIGFTQCGENPDPTPVTSAFRVEPGSPEIVIADRFDLRQPDQVIGSPDETRAIEVYGLRYRILDRLTGSILAESIGDKPRFSPTGRFVAALASNQIEIRDAVDGRFMYDVSNVREAKGVDLAWDDRDSFIIPLTSGSWGSIPLANTLNETSNIDNPGACSHVASAIFDQDFTIQLENNLLLVKCNSDSFDLNAVSLTVPREASADEASRTKTLVAAAAVSIPKLRGWSLLDGLKLSHLATSPASEDYQDPSAGILNAFLIKPMLLKTTALSALPRPMQNWTVATRGLRALKLPEMAQTERAERRLSEFGIEINHGTAITKLDFDAATMKVDRKARALADDGSIRFVSIGEGTSSDGEARVESGRTIIVISDQKGALQQVSSPGRKLTLINSSAVQGSMAVNYPSAYLHDSTRKGKLFDLTAEFAENGGTTCDDSFFSCDIQGALFFERYLVLWSKESAALAIYDVERRRLMHRIAGLPNADVVNRISLSRDLKTAIKLDDDGGFQVLGLRAGTRDAEGHLALGAKGSDLLLSGRLVDDEVAIWTPSGLFDATLEGAEHVGLRFPGRDGSYTLDQYRHLFKVDRLLTRVVAGETLPPPVTRDVPPLVQLERVEAGEAVAARITFAEGDPVTEVRLYQDGLITDTLPVPPGGAAFNLQAKRLPGARWMALLARGLTGLYSQPATYDAGQDTAHKRRLHLISVGIDHYEDREHLPDLTATVDARRFALTLQDKAGPAFEIATQAVLLDAEASREAILAKLEAAVAVAEPGDSIILFIAGHGVRLPGETAYYLATSATRADDLSHTALPWNDVSAVLARARTRVAVFLDTCQSGNAGTDFFATNDAAVGALIDRAPSGVLIFSASKGREKSEEAPDNSGGVFTGAVVSALSDPRTDLNRNGVIEASELYARVKRTVVEATQGRQTPWFARNDMVGDFVPF
ncbi:caspase family protein [Methylobacterium sp. J-070]|uniref:caspase family protein n=1 Tax=Methylobacterium sp. J-070 TaxID=2836650 RepID=UPI001FBAECCF|nr:caspase family protein [Methylobacterium sp. J-070]MCJ2051149.1 caspase family protein [Methylobacterium sp. J-070]